MTERISSSSNPLVKQLRALRQRKGRDEAGLFLVEGIHHVGEAIEAGWKVETLVYAPDQLKSDFACRLVDEQGRAGIRCVAMPANLFCAVAEKDNPQGILAVVKQRSLTLEDISRERFETGIALVSPQDPGNVGTILRTMDATGSDGLFLVDGGVDPYHPSCIRASMGTIFWLSLIRTSFADLCLWKQQRRYRMVGASAHAELDYRAFRRGNEPVILLLGNEQKGLSKEQLEACDVNVSMPMMGRVSSLNLAVAAGVLLYRMIGEEISRSN